MAITITSLTHPTMIAKIRKGLYYAHKSQGHMMNGHGNRVYIENAKGHNVMRLNWIGGRQGYVVLGNGNKDITKAVKMALHSVKVRDLALPYSGGIPKGKVKALVSKTSKALMIGIGATLLTACQSSGAITALYNVLGGLIV
ncbi:hypothetical protein PHB09_154 [Pseudomonas phage PHB09]|uniref:Uncharacterized protein n=1 Tax=Pseudomonas phage PHB09 TaxID=2867265 RepID=A0AAE8XF78_9CAUD|nr:hypothetical protein QGX10_gp153 [Pseudomonas phage PHB09]UAV84649.1 hypothetical protein PHB09_154 [Pseudomonas phage PHB09]